MTTLNVKGPSNLVDISAENMDLSGGLNVKGPSNLLDISAQNLEINETLNIVNGFTGNILTKSKTETITGTKTFTSTIIGNISGEASSLSTLTSYVDKTSNQTISGIKTFTNTIYCQKINSTRFKVTKPCTNVSVTLNSSQTANIATNVVLYSNRQVFFVHYSAFCQRTGDLITLFKIVNGTTLLLSKETPHEQRQINKHYAFGHTFSTSLAPQTVTLQVTTGGNVKMNVDDKINVLIIHMPY